MIQPITINVYGTPVAQPRPRGRAFIPRGGGKPRTMMYNPGTADAWKAAIAAAALPHQPAQPLDGAVQVHLEFMFSRPSSHYRTGKYSGCLKPVAQYYNTSKPDADNLAKAVLDCLTDVGGFWRDDSQVARLNICKRYGDAAGVTITICEIENQ